MPRTLIQLLSTLGFGCGALAGPNVDGVDVSVSLDGLLLQRQLFLGVVFVFFGERGDGGQLVVGVLTD